MSPSTATAHRDVERNRVWALLDNDWFAPVAAAAVAVVLAWLVVDEPARADLEVVNPSGREVSIQVRSGGDGWRRLATLPAGSERTVRDVIDRGDVWTIRFDERGRVLDEIEVGRDSLDEAGWRIEIPESPGR